jgi:hypothetical protein
VAVGLTLAGAIALHPRPSRACGPPYDPHYNDPPCSFVKLWTPAESFPRDLGGSIRVGTFERSYNSESSDPMFNPAADIAVHRASTGGYEAVAFTLAQQPGLVPNALQVVLADPQPGTYVVSTQYGTCDADPSPTGTGRLVGTFELEPSVALPAKLGNVTWLGTKSEQKVREVDDGNCGTTEVTTREIRSTFELQLVGTAMPWSNVIDSSLHVDGALYWGYSRLNVNDAGVARFELSHVCSSSDIHAIRVDEDDLGPGPHSFKVVARIEDLAMIESNETSFELSCGDGDADGGGSPSIGGCSTGSGARGHAWLLPLLAFAWRARSRARSAAAR